MNEEMIKLNTEALLDNRRLKIIAIEDIFKLKRLMFGMDIPGQDDVIKDPDSLFNDLYEKSVDDLDLIASELSALMSAKAKQIASSYKKNLDDGN